MPTRPRSLIAYLWIVLLIRGCLALGLGIVVLVTGEVHPGLANVLAVYWILGSVITMRWARAHRSTSGARVAYLTGLAGLVGSVAVLARGLLSGALDDEIASTLLGITCFVVGALRASGYFRESIDEEIRRSKPANVALGGLEMLLGVVLVLGAEGRPVVVPLLGAWCLVSGTIMLAGARRARRVTRSLKPVQG